MFLPNFSVILGHPKFESCLDGAQRVLVGSCKVLAMHLNVYAGNTIKTKICPVGHLKPVCSVSGMQVNQLQLVEWLAPQID